MLFDKEYSRTDKKEALSEALKIFDGKLFLSTDAEYIQCDKKSVIAVTGLPFYMPICLSLKNDPEIYEFMYSNGFCDCLFSYGENIVCFDKNGEKTIPESVAEKLVKIYKRYIGACGALDGNGTHIINLKSPRTGLHFDVNLLIGNRTDYPDPLLSTPKSAVDSLGRGSFRAGAARQVLSSRFTTDPAENGDPVNRQFYLFENGHQIFYSANISENVKSAECRHGRNKTEIEYITDCGLKISRTVFILPQEDNIPDAVEAQIIKIENLTERKRNLRITCTGMFGLYSPESAMNDIIYAGVTWEGGIYRLNGKAAAVVPHPNPKYLSPMKRFAALVCNGEFFDSYQTDYADFIGAGTLQKPENAMLLSSEKARKFVSFFALGKAIGIEPGESVALTVYTGMDYIRNGSDKSFDDSLYNFLSKYSKYENAEKALLSLQSFFDSFSSYIQLQSDDEYFNSYINRNHPFQVYYQAFVSRSFAWTQKAFREIGFREIQDLEAALYYFISMGKSGLVKEMIKKWASNVYEFGYANHNFYETGKEAGICSDDQLWLPQAIYRYITASGDYGFLYEKCDIAGSESKRTILETILAIALYSGHISTGKHGLPLIDRGDWNDCLRLDKAFLPGPEKEELYKKQLQQNNQKYGTPFSNSLSESVMNAFLLKIVYDETAELCESANETETAVKMRNESKALYTKLQEQCFKDGYFIRAFIGGNDKYTYLGSENDGLSADPAIKGTYYLNSFSWSVLSGVADEKQIRSMLGIIKKHLKTDAGLKLCTPAALEKLDAGNSAVNYFPGDRENGGVFKHANMMATAAMLKAAKAVKDEDLSDELISLAFETVGFILPYRTLENPYVLKGNPRFCTQYNNSETHENVGPMLSGTASWLALTVFEMLGIGYDKDGILLSPVLPAKINQLNFRLKYEEAYFNIEIKKHASASRVSESSVCEMDRKEIHFKIPFGICGEHKISIVL